MFKPMRRNDRQLNPEEAQTVLENGHEGTLSLAGGEYPYGTPMNYIVREGAIWMHGTRDTGDKDERIARNDHACFSTFEHIEGAQFKSTVAFGRIESIDDDDTAVAVLEGIVEKYLPPFAHEGAKVNIPRRAPLVRIYRMTIDHLDGKFVDRP